MGTKRTLTLVDLPGHWNSDAISAATRQRYLDHQVLDKVLEEAYKQINGVRAALQLENKELAKQIDEYSIGVYKLRARIEQLEAALISEEQQEHWQSCIFGVTSCLICQDYVKKLAAQAKLKSQPSAGPAERKEG